MTIEGKYRMTLLSTVVYGGSLSIILLFALCPISEKENVGRALFCLACLVMANVSAFNLKLNNKVNLRKEGEIMIENLTPYQIRMLIALVVILATWTLVCVLLTS